MQYKDSFFSSISVSTMTSDDSGAEWDDRSKDKDNNNSFSTCAAESAGARARHFLSKATRNSEAVEFVEKTKWINKDDIESVTKEKFTKVNSKLREGEQKKIPAKEEGETIPLPVAPLPEIFTQAVTKTTGATRFFQDEILPYVFCISDPDCCDSDYLKEQYYAQEVIDYLFLKDLEQPLIGSSYIKKLSELSPVVRRDIISWISSIHNNMRLGKPTLFLTVHLLDLYLKKNKTKLTELHAIALAALVLASKYEQRDTQFKLSQFTTICEDVVTREDILNYEMAVFQAANYSLAYVFPIEFAIRFAKVAALSVKEKLISELLCELSLLDIEMLDFSGKNIAAGAIIAALWCMSPDNTLKILKGNCEAELEECKTKFWSKTIESYSRTTWEKVQGPLHRFLLMIKRSSTVLGSAYTWEKYNTTQKLNVTSLVLSHTSNKATQAASKK